MKYRSLAHIYLITSVFPRSVCNETIPLLAFVLWEEGGCRGGRVRGSQSCQLHFQAPTAPGFSQILTQGIAGGSLESGKKGRGSQLYSFLEPTSSIPKSFSDSTFQLKLIGPSWLYLITDHPMLWALVKLPLLGLYSLGMVVSCSYILSCLAHLLTSCFIICM